MENLNEALATLINQATAGIDASVGFLQAEIPDVIVQLLMWHGLRSGLIAIIGLIIVIAIPYAYYKLVSFLAKPYPEPVPHSEYQSVMMYSKISGRWGDGQTYQEFGWEACLAVSGVVCLVGVGVGLSMLNLTWLQIWIAPKVWLIEYAANLVK